MAKTKEDETKKSFEIHFVTKEMELVKKGARTKIEVSELVDKGQLLASLTSGEEDGCRLIAGENCELSASEESLLATKAGYPQSEINTEEKTCIITLEPLVNISSNKMEADMTIYPTVGKKRYRVDDFLTILHNEGVSFGVDSGPLEQGMDAMKEEKQVISCIVALGEKPKNGKNGFVKLEIDLDTDVGKAQEDGSIDFKERKMFVYADEGQTIGTIVQPTGGTPGSNILGGSIEPRSGKEVTVRVTEDAIYDEKQGIVYAGKGGVVSVVGGANFKVSSKQTISGDIDFETGNIYAKNNVDITGDVKPDFVVRVRGDLRIGGAVRKATVNTQGNLVVSGGILGEKSQLNARGDVDIKFIERATIIAGGNIVLRNNAYYAEITGGGYLLGGNASSLVGGKTVCSGDIQVGSVGAGSSDPTYIAVGTDAKRLQEFEELSLQRDELDSEVSQLEKRYQKSERKPEKLIDKNQELFKIRSRLKILNLIHDTPEDSKGEEGFSECEAELRVIGTIMAGTFIRIGNHTKELEKDLEFQKFHIHPVFKAIVAVSLDKKT